MFFTYNAFVSDRREEEDQIFIIAAGLSKKPYPGKTMLFSFFHGIEKQALLILELI